MTRKSIMASYDQKEYFIPKNAESDDLSRERSSTMPSSTRENDITVPKRRTIFDPIYTNDIFSPEENEKDYLEDYLENLGEYHVRRDTRHMHLHTPLQFGARVEKDMSIISESSAKEQPKRNQQCDKTLENKSTENNDVLKDVPDIASASTTQKEGIPIPSGRPIKRSFELKDLKVYNSNKENQDAASTAAFTSSKNLNVNSKSSAVKSKDVQKSLNAIKTLSSKKIHVDAPKAIEKGFTSEIHQSNAKLSRTPKRQLNSNTSKNSERDINISRKELLRGVSMEERSPQLSSRILRLPKPPELDNISVSPERSMKRHSVAAKTSPMPNRKGPKPKKVEKSTMHSFFEAFM
jgi:hypothetical protein